MYNLYDEFFQQKALKRIILEGCKDLTYKVAEVFSIHTQHFAIDPETRCILRSPTSKYAQHV